MKINSDFGYKKLKDKFQNFEIPEGYEIVPVGEIFKKEYYYYHYYHHCYLTNGSDKINDWFPAKMSTICLGQKIDSHWMPVIREIQNQEKPKEIKQNKPIYQKIIDVKSGFVFINQDKKCYLIIDNQFGNYIIIYKGNLSLNFAGFPDKKEVLSFLNKEKSIFITDISDKISKTFDKAIEIMDNLEK